MDTTKAVTHVSLCAGYGGIDLGLKRAIPDLRTIAFAEIEAFACANLVAKMEAGCLDPAPIWTDVKTFPWAEFHGKVDILSGGYPCQPFSAAGKRLGKDDPRHLWPWIADGIRVLQPALCFFENVEGHISLGLRDVIGELEESGYRTTWGLFSAAEVGAPHQRKRVFILAHRLCERGQLPNWWRFAAEQMPVSNGTTGRDELALAVEQGPQGSASEPLHTRGLQSEIGRGCDVAWPSRPGQPQHAWEPPRIVGNTKGQRSSTFGTEHEGKRGELCAPSTSSQGVVGNSTRNQSQQRESGKLEQAHGTREGGNNAAADSSNGMGDTAQLQRNGGDDNSGNSQRSEEISESGNASWQGVGNSAKYDRRYLSERNSAFGLEQPSGRQTKPSLGGNADGPAGGMDYAELCISGDSRVDELRLLGNGVVPATAERAFNVLASRLFS